MLPLLQQCYDAATSAKSLAKAVQSSDVAPLNVGEWNDMDSLAAARPQMIGLLDTMRDMLEDLGGDLGVTDPVSGTVVADFAT